MSSILEALRELEGERPPANRRELPPPAKPGLAQRLGGAVIPILGGLAVGVVVFGFYAVGTRRVPAGRDGVPASVAPPVADAPAPDRPSWLDTAEAPRARVNRTGAGAPLAPTPVPERSASAERAPAAPERQAVDDAPAPVESRAEAKPASSGGQVAVESISYAASPEQRVATMRIHGRRVTLRQRESVDGIEVQLIMPTGVYVQRGGEVYLMPLSR